MSSSSANKKKGWSDTTPLLRRGASPPPPSYHSSSSPFFVEMSSSAVTSPRRSGSLFLGVDVGTSSARAGVFDDKGKLLGTASSPIQIWKEGDIVEQSSTDIWHAVCASVKSACSVAKVAGHEVTGIGFAATCSLVAVDSDGAPVTVSWSGDSRRNVIVWMDHRAVKQAEKINSFKSPVLEYCGGAVSPEMQPPKLLWVKENLPESWSMVFRWMDLSDWLSYRATGDDTRSLCTTVCKWTYLGHAHMQQMNENNSRDMEACGWDDDFWEEIGLGDLLEGHHAKIGRSVALPGHSLGSGLTPTAAKEMGLTAGIPVGTSLIDAHAGGVGIMESIPRLDSEAKESDKEAVSCRMALVCGTSTCHMAVSRSKLFIPGVWGPYWSETSIFALLNNILQTMAEERKSPFLAALTENTHVLPDFHGNRSPIADPKSKGIICGLTLDTSERQLALLYLAAVQGIAYGTRHIMEHCNAHGHKINTLLACGGLSKNSLYIQEHADIIGCPVVLPRESESVLLGAAILGAVAAKKYATLMEAMKALNAAGQVVRPSQDSKVKKFHDAKYKIFRELYEQQLSQRSAMAEALE
ncbi:FGGY carbohydrate kinase domain-containing protein [Linum grandiflorum]